MPGRKILICGDSLFNYLQGGAARSITEISLVLKKRGWEVVLLVRGQDSTSESEILDGIKIYSYKNSIFSIFKLLNMISTEKIELVNFHDPYVSFWVLLCLIFTGTKVQRIYTFQSPWPVEYYIRAKKRRTAFLIRFFGVHLRREIEKFVLKNSDKITVASEFMKKELKRLYGMDAFILPLGVNLEKFTPPRSGEKPPQCMKRSSGMRVFFTMRNLEPRMGLENLVEAVKILSDCGYRNLNFIIGGFGTLEAELEKRASELGIAGMIRFVGYIPDDDLRTYYGFADAFILPTKELEGFGLVTVEAMACGSPVLATPVGANTEVAGGFSGNVIFKSEKPVDIADGIKYFIDNLLGKVLSADCRAYVEKKYTLEKYAEAFESISASCPLCGGVSRLKQNGFLKCRFCGLFYKPFAPVSCTKNYEKEMEKIIYDYSVRKIFDFVLKKMRACGASGGRLLDIGCASGGFMSMAQNNGWEAEGIEISSGLAEECIKKGFKVYEKPVEELELPKEKYDAITALSVLHVMENPFLAVEKIKNLLKPGGLLVIREYNSRFHCVAYNLTRFLGFLKIKPYIFHKWNFSAKTLSFLLEKNGFEVIYILNSRLTEGDPYGTGGLLGKAGTSFFKVFYSAVAYILYILSFGKIFISSSIMVFARKKS